MSRRINNVQGAVAAGGAHIPTLASSNPAPATIMKKENTMERSEQEKVTQAPLMVILGGREFPIVPLVIKYSGEWRKKSLPLIQYLIGYAQKSEDDMLAAVAELFTTKTDEILDSFFEYARNLNREEIEEIATDGEIITSFMEVFNAFVSPLSAAAVKAPLETPPKKKVPPRRVDKDL